MRMALLRAAVTVAWCGWMAPRVQQETVPFVGCPSDGQMGPIAAPTGAPKVVALDAATAREIAYYSGDGGPAAFAPRGWYCQVSYGSSGSTIYVTPSPIDSMRAQRPKTAGSAVEVEFLDGGTSGRFGVARFASRLFPRVAATFIQEVKSRDPETASDIAWVAHDVDSVTYSDSLTAEFTTPANQTGLGTAYNFGPSPDAIRGVAVLAPSSDWGLTIVRVRLGPGMSRIESAILKLNTQCVKKSGGC